MELPGAALAAGPEAWREAGAGPLAADSLVRALDPPAHPRLAGRARPSHHRLATSDYPALLRRIPSPPLALFVRRRRQLLWHPSVAVVGSRIPSAGGRDNARAFATALSNAGFAVCSGLASGVDAAAHDASLAVGGATIAVLGSGIDVPSLERRPACAHRRARRGGQSEIRRAPAREEHFPSRNRIIAGLRSAPW